MFPLVPEFIVPQDGHTKQDCEIAAAKRWLTTHAQTYRSHRIMVLGDGLYCHEMRVAVMAEKFERVRTLG